MINTYLKSTIIATAAIFALTTIAFAEPPIKGHMQTFIEAEKTQKLEVVQWKDKNGKSVSIDDFKGKHVLLNFWASWCPPCIRELPSLNSLQKTLGSDNFVVVAVSIDRSLRAAKRLHKRLKLTNLPLYIDVTNELAKAYKIRSMPTTLLIGSKGELLGKVEGLAEWDTDDGINLIQYYIKASKK